MIIDGFMYNGEKECLLIRLEELYDVVDWFVIAEATNTFRGEPKNRLYYYDLANDNNFYKYINKIQYRTVTLSPGITWDREHELRNFIYKDTILDPEDIVMISDCDEIPSREAVQKIPELLSEGHEIVRVEMPLFYFRFNLQSNETYQLTKAIYWRNFKSGQQLRQNDNGPILHDGGWSFTYLGNTEFINRKIRSFSHAELDREEYTNLEKIQARIDQAKDPFDRFDLTPVKRDSRRWPKLLEESNSWSELWVDC